MIRRSTTPSAIVILAIAIMVVPIDAQDSLPQVDFSHDVQPLLAKHCVRCHGNSEAEGGLRLTDRDAALADLDSGNRAIVPGDFQQSELWHRVATDDPDRRMPPEGEGLSSGEIDLLRQWIASGADWPAHWAYRSLRDDLPPSVDGEEFQQWARSPIDRFVLAKLHDHGLQPSPRADRRTLLRRVYFDLIGLPPTNEDVAAFLADDSPDAWCRVVDRLLASPSYGERWARHWMDVVHYAETHGHDQDRPREHAWPYRDYLIRSFNHDKPYARFVQEQIAGDAMFADDPEAIVATGFLATGPWDESSLQSIREDTLDREIARYVDRDDIVTTVISTFASSTVHCARCHDHKFDPISQQQYYGLQAVFAATDKANRHYDADRRVAMRRQQITTDLAALPDRIAASDPSLLEPTLQEQVSEWAEALSHAAAKWQIAELMEYRSGGGAELTKNADGSLLAGGTRPGKDVYHVTVRSDLRCVGRLRLELLADESLPQRGPGRADNGNLHLNELRVWEITDGEERSERPVEIKNAWADFNQQGGWSIDAAIDGNPNTAWGIYPETGKSHQAVFVFTQPIRRDEPITLRIELHQIHGDGHVMGRLRLWATDVTGELAAPEELSSPELVELLQTPENERSDSQRMELAGRYLKKTLEQQLASLPPQQVVYCGTNHFASDGSFRPADVPRKVYLLKRGDIRQPAGEADPLTLDCLPDLDDALQVTDLDDEGARRVALARWMTDGRNVLVWRSIVNRIWHYHFGRGIVDTPSDFGRMGDQPSHPQLLDWLTRWFQRQGGSLKELHRLIVTSETYAQSSQYNARFAEIDADNRFLWRVNRRRLDAESLRDAVLRIAGQLDATMGGPSVKQFIQTNGMHVTPDVDYANFDVNDPANRRRSVYRFIFRTLPDPFMEALDCPDPSQLTPVRNSSNTALQALAMLNDKLIIRQSEIIADHVSQAADGMPARVQAVFRQILGREPTDREEYAVTEYAIKHGLANACRYLLNTNEFAFVD